ncbi:hypothetical protein ONE63_010703 [Megalurothrips usitatus]|uniref:Uncharacterized protein n=1 Tax=Megalurothrips usitatus TaxID=439358 RepID=A0AAV7XKD9_9NEOP|nr:hypothetical protein ONE63_010703 [Megalurothrips usitatus]
MLQPVVDWPTDEPPCEGVNDAVLRKVTEYALGLQNHHDLTKLLLKLNLTHEEISEFINVGAVSTNASVVATRCRPNSCNYSYCDGADSQQ